MDQFKRTGLHLFDIDVTPLDAAEYVNWLASVQRHLGDSPERLAGFSDDYSDMMYIDALHSYVAARRDAEVARCRMKRGGIFVFSACVIWSIYEFSMCGVVRACSELCRDRNLKWKYLALHPNMHCDVAGVRP